MLEMKWVQAFVVGQRTGSQVQLGEVQALIIHGSRLLQGPAHGVGYLREDGKLLGDRQVQAYQ